MRSAMRCAACVLHTSHDAAPIAATAAMMRSHAASMPVPPSCSRVDTEPGSLSHAYGEREVFRFQGGGFGETREAPGLGICCCSGAFGGDKSTQPSAPLQCRPFSPTVRGAEFSRSGAASSRYLRGISFVAGLPLTPRCLRRPRGMLWRGWVKQSTPRGLPALQCHQLCPRRFYRVKGWWKAAGAPIS